MGPTRIWASGSPRDDLKGALSSDIGGNKDAVGNNRQLFSLLRQHIGQQLPLSFMIVSPFSTNSAVFMAILRFSS